MSAEPRKINSKSRPAPKASGSGKKKINSCLECRRRKIKCNRIIPCDRCIERGEKSLCQEAAIDEVFLPHASNTLSHSHGQIRNRVSSSDLLLSIDARLEELVYRVRTLEDNAGISPQSEPGTRPPMRQDSPDVSVNNDLETEEVVHLLEDMAYGRHESAQQAAVHLLDLQTPVRPSTSAGSPAVYTPRWTLPLPQHHMEAPRSMGRVERPLSAKTESYLRSILEYMPTSRQTEGVAVYYCSKLEFLHRVIHVPSFRKDLHNFFTTPIQLSEVDWSFVALLMTVACVSLHFCTLSDALELGYSEDQHREWPEHYFSAASAALWASDYLEKPNLRSLQTIIIMGLYLNNTGSSDTHSTLIGSAIKIGTNMGLSRLGAERPNLGTSDPRWVGRWSSIVDREVGRRIWWNLIILDLLPAGGHQFCYSINASQNKTALPAHVNDEDIQEGKVLQERPLSEHTNMTYHLFKIRFALIYRTFIDRYNERGTIDQSFTIQQDQELREVMEELPIFYQTDAIPSSTYDTPDVGDVLARERVLIQLTGQIRLVRLHRPFMLRGYVRKEYEYSRLTAVSAARTCLAIVREEAVSASGFPHQWWTATFYIFTAAIVLIMDLSLSNERGSEEEKKRSEILSAIGTIKSIGDMSSSARDAGNLLENLLKQTTSVERQEPIRQKRKHNEEEAEGSLRQLVKRLMVNPQDEQAHTPTPHPVNSDSNANLLTPTASAFLPLETYQASYLPQMPSGPVPTQNSEWLQTFANPYNLASGSNATLVNGTSNQGAMEELMRSLLASDQWLFDVFDPSVVTSIQRFQQ